MRHVKRTSRIAHLVIVCRGSALLRPRSNYLARRDAVVRENDNAP